jgi:hypothetical protein
VTVGSTLGAPIVVGLVLMLAATRIPVMARVLAAPGTPARLAVPQTLRVAGGSFLVLLALGEMPATFALPAGIGDVTVGLTASLVAWRLYRGRGRRAAVWFNVLGIVDLVVAVTMAGLSGLAQFTVLTVTPSMDALTRVPEALIPASAVPLALVLHIVSLRRLSPTAVPVPAVA